MVAVDEVDTYGAVDADDVMTVDAAADVDNTNVTDVTDKDVVGHIDDITDKVTDEDGTVVDFVIHSLRTLKGTFLMGTAVGVFSDIKQAQCLENWTTNEWNSLV